MHMADALLSPGIAAAFGAVSLSAIAYSARKLQNGASNLAPLMGVLGAFVFAAQMINFSLPGTGASGHLAGGLLLSLLLGPVAAFLVMVSILIVQALVFADGGLLALGANIFNLGMLPCLILFPLLKPLLVKPTGQLQARYRVVSAAILMVCAGATMVVVQTCLSGITALPFKAFIALMLPVHLLIGLAEGLVTVAVFEFLQRQFPALLQHTIQTQQDSSVAMFRGVAAIALIACLIGGGLSSVASEHPDGLEWSIDKVTQQSGQTIASNMADTTESLQQAMALMPDYQLKASLHHESPTTSWQAYETSLSGFLGIAVTLLMIALMVVTIQLLQRFGRKRLLEG